MFAVIKTGGKQYRVAQDDVITVETVAGAPGELVELKNVLMIGGEGQEPTVGAPLVEKAAVFAEVVEQTRGEKIIVFKKKRRKHYRRKTGHRQNLTVLRIAAISPTGEKPAVSAKAPAKAKAKPAAKAEEGEVEAAAKPAKKPAKAKAAAKPKAAPKKEAKPKAAKSGAKKPAKAKE